MRLKALQLLYVFIIGREQYKIQKSIHQTRRAERKLLETEPGAERCLGWRRILLTSQ